MKLTQSGQRKSHSLADGRELEIDARVKKSPARCLEAQTGLYRRPREDLCVCSV